MSSPFHVRWENFRGFRDTGWFEIRPITILIGPNNSGKTSLIAPLLLLKQTYESTDTTSGLVTRGELQNVGAFADFVHRHNRRLPVRLGIRFHTHGKTEKAVEAPVSSFAPGEAVFTFGGQADRDETLLRQYLVRDPIGRRYLARTRLSGGRYTVGGPAWTEPRRQGQHVGDWKRSRQAILDSRPTNFLFTVDALVETFYQHVQQAASHRRPELPRNNLVASLYVAVIGNVQARVGHILSNVHYVGPLRSRPERIYQLSGEIPQSVGMTGRHAPELILRHSRDQIRTQLNKWLRRFDLASGVDTESLAEGAFTLRIRRRRAPATVNMADTGFGISQVLPLIVQGLVMPDGALMIAEQPEIHLNPRLQAALADLFTEFAVSGKSVLIETHSEHLLLRLRRLVAEGKIASNQVAIYFVERSQAGASIREIPLERSGHIPAQAWPKGFFAQPLEDAIGLTEAQLKKQRRA